jgi:HD-GYP domain-containing protein (c-di-GMP phosphodiesterase class II)/DNA-binding CsgD family transcriptional regulator
MATMLANAPRVLPGALRGRCEVAIRFAVRLGLGPRVARALDEAFERWDGKGLPAGRRGDDVCIAARVISLAELAASYLAVGGIDGARDVVVARSGGHVDPSLARLFARDTVELVGDAMSASLWDRVLEVEPRPVAHVGPTQRFAVAELLADFADLKSTWTLGHSRGVARRALNGAKELGASDEELEQIQLAALVHDVGCVAVSNALWDKPGSLSPGELDQVRSHAFHTHRIVSAIGGGIGQVAPLASVTHERIDGSGYYRGIGSSQLSRWSRLLAAADVAQALSEARPHRPLLPKDDAERTLRDIVRQGLLCPRAVEAVLGPPDGKPKPRACYPAGLSEREVEVLRLVARGLTDKEIAAKLGISFRTVHHHNQHAYDKIGVSTRAAAALFLIENDLLDG